MDITSENANEVAENIMEGIEEATPVENIKREFFVGEHSRDAMIAAVAKAQRAALAAKHPDTGEALDVRMNFDAEKPLPNGYGIAVLPIDRKSTDGKRGAKQQRIGMGIVALPSANLLINSDDEPVKKWVSSILEQTLLNKLANALRPKEDGSSAPSLPFSVHDFCVVSRPQTTAVWNEIAPPFLSALQQRYRKSFRGVTRDIFRRLLSSAEYAQQVAPSTKQELWVKLIERMRDEASKAGKDPQVFQTMLETREKVSFEISLPNVDDLDI